MRMLNDLFSIAVKWLCDNGKVRDQKELAERTGITETTISRILNDKVKRPSDATVRKLMKTFPGLFNPDYFEGKSIYMLMEDLLHARMQVEEKKQDSQDMQNLLKKIAELEERIAEKNELIAYYRKIVEDLSEKVAESDYKYPFPPGVADLPPKKGKRL
jgi:transcriptional regulator with XRE-family HTH domain